MTHPLCHSLGGRVSTHLGLGWLWQVFAGRVGVVLDDLPGRVVFLEGEDPDVHPMPATGARAPWLTPKLKGKKPKASRQAASFFGLGSPDDRE